MAMLGVPYGDAVVGDNASRMARAQAKQIADGIVQQGGPANLDTKEIVALTAYLQRLGRDIKQISPPTRVGAASATASTGGAHP
jgi:cytochrome c oxidase cbb3-type subunit I/II